MTHHDPVTGETHEHVTEERVVTPAAAPVAPAPSSDQVNVNAAGQRTYVESGPSGLAVVRRIVGLIFGILIGLILLRFVLLLLGANADNGIVDAIYGLSEPLVAPFRGIFSLETFRPSG